MRSLVHSMPILLLAILPICCDGKEDVVCIATGYTNLALRKTIDLVSKNRHSFLENYDVPSCNKYEAEEFKGHLKPFGESGRRVPVQGINGFPSDLISKNRHSFPENYDAPNCNKYGAEEFKFKGHLKPFGESGRRVPVQEINGFPSDINKNFFIHYLLPSVPVLMKGAARKSPHFHKWTDDHLLSLSSKKENAHFEMNVEVGKKENRDAEQFSMKFHEFLEVYNSSDLYMVSDLPPWMEALSLMPCPLQCPHLNDVPMQKVLWFSSGGTKSVVHTDVLENINCLYRGNKTLITVDHNTIGAGAGTVIDDIWRSMSKLDVDRVDLNRYPTLHGATFITVFMEAGDCLYIPNLLLHQVRSFGSNLAINVWFDGSPTRDQLKKGDCMDTKLVCDPTFTLNRVKHPPIVDPDVLSQDRVIILLRLVFEYSTTQGKAAISHSHADAHMTIKGDKVKLEEFIQELIGYEDLLEEIRESTRVERSFHNTDYYEEVSTDIDKDIGGDAWNSFVDSFGDFIRRLDTNYDDILTSLEFEKGIGDILYFLAAQ